MKDLASVEVIHEEVIHVDNLSTELMTALLQDVRKPCILKPDYYQTTIGVIDLQCTVLCRFSKTQGQFRYDVVNLQGDKLGRGGFGTVYEVVQSFKWDGAAIVSAKHFDRVVKVVERKEKHPDAVRDGIALDKFYDAVAREYRAAVRIPDQHVKPPVLFNTEAYIVMRQQPGENLRELIRKDALRELSTLARIVLSFRLLAALKAVHDAGIVHRDLSPRNVMIDLASLEVHIVDCGLCVDKTQANKVNVNVGTEHYRSPEAALGLFNDERSDVFSIGRLLALIWGEFFEFMRKPYLREQEACHFTNLFENTIGLGLSTANKQKLEALLLRTGFMPAQVDKRPTVDEMMQVFSSMALIDEASFLVGVRGVLERHIARYSVSSPMLFVEQPSVRVAKLTWSLLRDAPKFEEVLGWKGAESLLEKIWVYSLLDVADNVQNLRELQAEVCKSMGFDSVEEAATALFEVILQELHRLNPAYFAENRDLLIQVVIEPLQEMITQSEVSVSNVCSSLWDRVEAYRTSQTPSPHAAAVPVIS